MRTLVTVLALILTAPAMAQTSPAPPSDAPPAAAAPVADPAVRQRADALVALLGGKGDYETLFAPAFRAAVPQAQFDEISAQLRTALGQPSGVEQLTATGRWSADVTIGYERGTAAMKLALDPAATGDHAITGLLVTGTAPRGGETAAALSEEFAKLPGQSGYAIYALGDGAPRLVEGLNQDRPAPLGSAFKLWVLAEAARQVAASERRWTDVVKLDATSLPSGVTQNWPKGAPVTLHTLATLMISISDNTATDTLMTALGRQKVDALATAAGGSAPVLTTREAFAIKADPALTARWAAADAGGRRTLLAQNNAALAAATLNPEIFASGKPLATTSVEWFASPADTARLLDRLRRAGDTTLGILKVNGGTDPAIAKRFDYLGYKGGSEPGVLSMGYLVRTKAGRWFAVVGNWHREDEDVTLLQFTGLMGRALVRAAEAS